MTIAQLIYRRCGLCDCGTDSPANLLLNVLRLAASNEDWTVYTSVEVELSAKVLDGAGLVTHGSGIGICWITEQGRDLLKEIEEIRQG
jgi:hypothetical protein